MYQKDGTFLHITSVSRPIRRSRALFLWPKVISVPLPNPDFVKVVTVTKILRILPQRTNNKETKNKPYSFTNYFRGKFASYPWPSIRNGVQKVFSRTATLRSIYEYISANWISLMFNACCVVTETFPLVCDVLTHIHICLTHTLTLMGRNVFGSHRTLS